ncbi:hypothetical protein CC2G_001566 [Coprinopsis cinerea AmutBmut pab1-1]|nr:hypothetical protein CC2G_001566 [Coprinopsis cinerea AmutBmut pab1-1]
MIGQFGLVLGWFLSLGGFCLWVSGPVWSVAHCFGVSSVLNVQVPRLNMYSRVVLLATPFMIKLRGSSRGPAGAGSGSGLVWCNSDLTLDQTARRARIERATVIS